MITMLAFPSPNVATDLQHETVQEHLHYRQRLGNAGQVKGRLARLFLHAGEYPGDAVTAGKQAESEVVSVVSHRADRNVRLADPRLFEHLRVDRASADRHDPRARGKVLAHLPVDFDHDNVVLVARKRLGKRSTHDPRASDYYKHLPAP
jgi:hypothetical protein